MSHSTSMVMTTGHKHNISISKLDLESLEHKYNEERIYNEEEALKGELFTIFFYLLIVIFCLGLLVALFAYLFINYQRAVAITDLTVKRIR